MQNKRISSHLEGSAVQSIRKQFCDLQDSREFFANKATQTEFRESESQTVPWEPPYKITTEESPEVLTLTDFTWGQGLPAGMHELEKINRMRKKRAWQKVLPPMDTPANIEKCSQLITALDSDSWAFREAEIQFIIDLRLDLAEKLMESVEIAKKKERASRFERYDQFLSSRKQREIGSIRNKFNREMRKIALKQRAFKTSSRRGSAKLSRHFDFGDLTPLYNHHARSFSEELKEKIEAGDSWITPTGSSCNYASSYQICPKIQKRDEKNLKKLYNSLESARESRMSKEPEAIDFGLLCTKIEGRYRESPSKNSKPNKRRIEEILKALEGKTMTRMLVFLNEELKKLQTEKKAHAKALLNQGKKKSQSRRGEAAGDRAELDEMFRKILKISRESVEMYLEDVAKGENDTAEDKEVERCIAELSNKLDRIEHYLSQENAEEDLDLNFAPSEIESKRMCENSINSESADKSVHDQQLLDCTAPSNDDLDSSIVCVTERIMDYVEMSDGENKKEIREIFEVLFKDAQKNFFLQ